MVLYFPLNDSLLFKLLGGIILYYCLGYLQREVNYQFKIPRNFQDLRELRSILKTLLETNPNFVLTFFCTLYILKQMFSIPGSALLNILAGDLLGFTYGFPLVCLMTTLGASCCYLLARSIGKHTIQRFFLNRIQSLQKSISDHQDNLFYFLLFARLVPFSPNWLLNITCGIAEVPFHYFFFSVLLGLIPYNFVCVQAGSMINNLNSIQDVFDTSTMINLTMMALMALFPVILKRKKNKKSKE